MRKELFIILVMVLGGAFVVNSWLGNSPLTLHSTRGLASVQGAPEPSKVPEKATEAKAVRRKADEPAGRSALASRVALDSSGPANSPTAAGPSPAAIPKPGPGPRPDLPFPTPENLKVGSTTTEIRSAFGAPSFDIAGTTSGHVQERFYYVNRDQTRLTVLTIQNGLLTSAESVSSPYFQLPSPVKPDRAARPDAR